MPKIVIEIRGGCYSDAHADESSDVELIVVDHDNLSSDSQEARKLIHAGVLLRDGDAYVVNDRNFPFGVDMPEFEDAPPLAGLRWYEVTLRVRVKVDLADLSGLQTGDNRGEPFHDEILPYVIDELEEVQRDASRTAIVEIRDLGEPSPTGLQEG